MSKVIDLSTYNTVIDWSKVKQNVDGVIIRCAYRGYGSGRIVKDKKSDSHAANCKVQGIPFGFYFMSQAINEDEGREEAEYIVNIAREYGATLPLYIDSEDGDGTARVVRADGLSKSKRTAVVKAFCEKVKELGYTSGVYASESWFCDRLEYNALKDYDIWVAKYGKNTGEKCTSVKLSKYDMYQYTSNGSIPGIIGKVDVNERNGIVQVQKPIDVVDTNNANEVIRQGQINANNFAQCGLVTDGVRGKLTKMAGNKVLQRAMNCDYNVDLVEDSIIGNKSKKALGNHYVKCGEIQYMVTALEILLMLKGYDPHGIECPGVFGNGLYNRVIDYQRDNGLVPNGVADRNTFLSLIS